MIEGSTKSQEAAIAQVVEDATTYLKNQREYLVSPNDVLAVMTPIWMYLRYFFLGTIEAL
jgi:hypothetical protein